MMRCAVEDGRFVKPCAALAAATGGALSHSHFMDSKTRKPTRSYFVLKSGANKKCGMAVNVCPFCGVRIDAPFSGKQS